VTRVERMRRGWAHTAHKASIREGWAAACCVRNGDPAVAAYRHARTAAHHAFRAVPALRGDR
jgi:hypothetical protein